MVRIIVTGGSGYVGQNIIRSFLESKNSEKDSTSTYQVLALDVSPPSKDISLIPFEDESSVKSESICYFKEVNLIDSVKVEEIFKTFKPNAVIHLASWGMSGPTMLDPKCQVQNVSVTSNLIELCAQYDVSSFIYTSTYNVIFGGREIAGGDENSEYFPVDHHTDWYSRSKSEAEQLVLSANGKETKGGLRLATCSLRPAAIYGIDEQRHLPRILQFIDCGLFFFRIGSATVDWVHVDNLVDAYKCALNKLVSGEGAAGQSYFISDGTPIENFEFLRPLCQSRGRAYPTLVIPTAVMLLLAHLCEIGYAYFGIHPFLTRAEVYKVGVTHYFSIAKASRELNYNPKITSQAGAQQLATHYGRKVTESKHYFKVAAFKWWALVLFGMGQLYIVAFVPDFGGVWMEPFRVLGLKLFGSEENLRNLFAIAVGLHVLEAIMAVSLSRYLQLQTWWLWAMQTFFLGYPSLSLLLAWSDKKGAAAKKR